MRINTIYKAIEGEGVNIGTRVLFIRTQGCKLLSEGKFTNCINCDTIDSWDFTAGKEMSLKEIYQEVVDNGLDNISITGGNPLFAKGIEELVDLLSKRNYWINIEATGQDFNGDVFDQVSFISCDIKTPSTGVVADISNIRKIINKYHNKMQLKCVCADEGDLNFIINTFKHLSLLEENFKHVPLIATPCWTEKDSTANIEFIKQIEKAILDNNLNIRMICQQHKFLHSSTDPLA